MLTSSVFVHNLDELMNHYDVRGPYATEMGRELARVYDKNVARMYALAARSPSPLTGRAGGSVISDPAMATDADVLATALFAAAQTFDEKFVMSEDRWAALRPAQYYLAVQNEKLLDESYSRNSADLAAGTIQSIAGIAIGKTINLPSADDTANTAIPAKYRADFTDTVAVVGNRWAVGTLQLQDLAMESDYEVRRQGTFMVAKQALGSDVLRADCAIELSL